MFLVLLATATFLSAWSPVVWNVDIARPSEERLGHPFVSLPSPSMLLHLHLRRESIEKLNMACFSMELQKDRFCL